MVFTAIGFPPGGSFRCYVPKDSNINIKINVLKPNYIKMDLQEVGCVGEWNGSSWLRIGTSGGHL